MVTVDGQVVMAVLPAHLRLDLEAFAASAAARDVELADEAEFRDLFPDCEVGAMPPFGNLYGVDVYMDRRLNDDDSIVFDAGTHHEAIRLAFADFAGLVKPSVGDFARP